MSDEVTKPEAPAAKKSQVERLDEEIAQAKLRMVGGDDAEKKRLQPYLEQLEKTRARAVLREQGKPIEPPLVSPEVPPLVEPGPSGGGTGGVVLPKKKGPTFGNG